MRKDKFLILLLLFVIIVILTTCGLNSKRTTNISNASTDTYTESVIVSTEITDSVEMGNAETVDINSTESSSVDLQVTTETEGNYIVVNKSDRQLILYDANGNILAQYSVGLSQNPIGAKEKEGDKKTPEGEYYICVKNANSKFHKALGISYPNIQDAENGLENGLITEAEFENITSEINNGKQPDWYTALGGEIMIHGQKGNLGSQSNWTTGCIAVDNDVIDKLWDQVQVGTRVTILP